jgi:hypothetical protein
MDPDDHFAVGLPGVARSPDRAVDVLAEKEANIFRDCDSPTGPAANISIRRDKTGNEVFVIAARFAGRVIKRHAHDFVTGALRWVPRPVKCRENIAFVFSTPNEIGIAEQKGPTSCRFSITSELFPTRRSRSACNGRTA